MTTWHYQATKRTTALGDIYEVREVYVNEGELTWTMGAVAACGDTKDDLIKDLRRMLADVLARDVLDVTEAP